MRKFWRFIGSLLGIAIVCAIVWTALHFTVPKVRDWDNKHILKQEQTQKPSAEDQKTKEEIAELKAQITEKDQTISVITAELNKEKQSTKDLTIEKDNAVASLNELTQTCETLKADIQTKQAKIEELQNKVTQDTQSIQTLQAEISSLQSELEEAQTSLAQKQTEVETLTTEITNKTNTITSLQAQIEELETQADADERIIESYSILLYTTQEELAQAESNLQTANETITSLNAQIQTKTSELETKQARVDELETQATQNAQTIATLQESLTAKQNELATTQASLNAKISEVESLTETLNAKIAELDAKIAEITRLENQITLLNQSIANLQEQVSMAYNVELVARYQSASSATTLNPLATGTTGGTVGDPAIADGTTVYSVTCQPNVNYIFLGWYKDEACTQLISSNTVDTIDLATAIGETNLVGGQTYTFYACFQIKKELVTMNKPVLKDLNGNISGTHDSYVSSLETVIDDEDKVSSGDLIVSGNVYHGQQVKLLVSSMNGYKFMGYYKEQTLQTYCTVTDGYITANGTTTVYPCFKSTGPVVSSTFADNSWETIATVSETISSQNMTSAQVHDTYGWSIGDEKSFTLTTGEQVTAQILGFNHDDKSDETGKTGITLGFKNGLSTAYAMNNTKTNVGGWESSLMRTETIQTVYSQFPEDLKAIIKTVNKTTSEGNTSRTIVTTQDKLFLFSQEEIIGTNKNSTNVQISVAGEGTQYEYYKSAPIPTPSSGSGSFTALTEDSGTFYTDNTSIASGYIDTFSKSVTTSTLRYYNFNITKNQGNNPTGCIWYLRSPYLSTETKFCCVLASGCCSHIPADANQSLVCGFCI